MDLATLPAGIRAILDADVANPSLTEGQTEELVAAAGGDTPAQTGQEAGSSSTSQHTHAPPLLLTNLSPQQILMGNLSSKNQDDTATGDAGQSLSPENLQQPQEATAAPLEIQNPVRILKRIRPQKVTPQKTPPENSEFPYNPVPEPSTLMIPPAGSSVQKWNKAKAAIPKSKPRRPPPQQGEKGKKIMDSSKTGQKPKKGVPILIPPKPVMFKKMAQNKPGGASKQAKNKQAAQRAAEVIKGPDGFFQVAVQYGLCKDLAEGLGLKPTDVTEALELDNQQRKQGLPVQSDPMDLEIDEEGLDLEFDSDEDLLSDEEGPAQA